MRKPINFLIKKFLVGLFDKSMLMNKDNIVSMITPIENASLLDLGCNDGGWSCILAEKAGIKDLYGIDIVDERIKQAEALGIKVKKADLNNPFPYPDNSFDIAHANQVIEHIAYLDTFVSEIYRVLKPGGYCVISSVPSARLREFPRWA